MIRSLDRTTDAEAVLDLYRRATDFLLLESGRVPDAALVEEYFAEAPPDGDPATSLKLGLFQGPQLLGLADLAFGYPTARDAYLGLMLLAQDARGRGLGREFLRHTEEAARQRGATRLLLAVLEANPRGRAFWEREGFGSPKVFPARQIGTRTHVLIRLERPL
ncbi:GNAT family N-acetyltransferase [Rubellimicrobium arenae]|uniref:GNAT family N-acetyltransferase n=1 Tax=Rubellimicrobium arenae TaxID=2817372 RepID=UPI001B3054B0|nr:GNAT family N-acetyltransferase [Rubellimicrobium arenae]